jgi:hypothetical protein
MASIWADPSLAFRRACPANFSLFSRAYIRPSSLRSRVVSAVASHRVHGRLGVRPLSRREAVATIVEQPSRDPRFLRHLPHGALAPQRKFRPAPIVVLVVMPT